MAGQSSSALADTASAAGQQATLQHRSNTGSTCAEPARDFIAFLHRLTDDRRPALRLVGDGRVQPISEAGLAFVLDKAAATVIPLRLWLDGQDAIRRHEGPIRAVQKLGAHLHLSGPGWKLYLPVRSGHQAWVVHEAGGSAGSFALAIFGPDQRRVAQIGGLRERCIAWRALMEWLLLREREVR